MVSSRAAIRYAQAILDLANSTNISDVVNNDLILIGKTIKNNKELNTFIQNPIITVEAKENALLEIFQNSNKLTKQLLHLLHENKRFEILETIASEYSKLFDIQNNVEIAIVTTAMSLDSALEAKVMEKIRTFSDKKITIQNIVDSSIIGGFILKIKDKQYNASISNRLQVLKRELSN